MAVVDEQLEAAYAPVLRKFDTLCSDTHLPFLEVKLYQKYFVHVKTEARLENLKEINEVLAQHRASTLNILKVIHERERVFAKLLELEAQHESGAMSTLDVQTSVLHILYRHQQATLKVAEAIEKWRALLTRPYAFQWQGKNYFLKIQQDCAGLDNSKLKMVLPMHLEQFPLCSNLPSLPLFAEVDGRSANNSRTSDAKAASERDTARLRHYEAILLEERSLQQKLLRELQSICADGAFVPLLHIPELVPNCASGIRISNDQNDWNEQLKHAIETAQQNLDPKAERREDDDDEGSRKAEGSKRKETKKQKQKRPQSAKKREQDAPTQDEKKNRSPEASPKSDNDEQAAPPAKREHSFSSTESPYSSRSSSRSRADSAPRSRRSSSSESR